MRMRLITPALVALGASLCFLYVAIDRWSVCLTGSGEVCLAHQGDSYDAALATSGSAQLSVLLGGYILLACCFLLLGLEVLHAPRIALLAVPALAAALWFVPWATGPLAYIALLAHLIVGIPLGWWFFARAHARPVATGLFVAGVVLTNFVVDAMLVAPLLNGGASHDTTPWTWLPSAVGAMLMACGLLMVGPGQRTSSTPSHGRAEMLAEAQA